MLAWDAEETEDQGEADPGQVHIEGPAPGGVVVGS